MKKFIFIIGSLLVMTWPTLVQADDYCDDFDKQNVYADAYCTLRLNGNKESEKAVLETVAKQLDYNKGLATWMLEQGDGLSCGGIKSYLAKNNLSAGNLNDDIKQACTLSNEEELEKFYPIPIDESKEQKKQRKEEEARSKLTGGTDSRGENLIRLKNRLKIAYEKEDQINLHKTRLEETFKSSERYWDGQLEVSTPFDIMVDLNLMDDILFGSRAQWVNDVYGFSKGQNVQEPEPLFQPINNNNQNNLPQNQNEQQVQQNNEEGQLAEDFVHPDCFKPTPKIEPLCGNGVIDVLTGEECDDGNTADGDGCNSHCEISFGTLQCKDPFAVNLQPFAELAEEQQNNNPLCPPNFTPPNVLNEEAQANNELNGDEQEAPIFETPPFIGGTLTPPPVTDIPACPAGESLVKLTALGGGEGKEISKCIPTNFCGDFNAIRTALFGQGWQEGENADIAASIEAAVCVNFTTLNRPNTPYAPNEGCIDCHFRAMADSLEEALESNVTPLTNTTGAFALSNRWGPNFSLDLNVGVQKAANLDLAKRNTEPTPEEKEKEKKEGETAGPIDDANDANKAGESSVASQESATQLLVNQVSQLNTNLNAISESLQTYQVTSNSTSDFAFSNQVIPQIGYLTGNFSDIQVSLSSMVDVTKELSKKPICKL